MNIMRKLLFVLLIHTIHCSLSMKIVVKNDTKWQIENYNLIVYEFSDNFRSDMTGQNLVAGTSSNHSVEISSGIIYYFGLIIYFKSVDQDSSNSKKVVVQVKSFRKLFNDDTVNISISDEQATDINLDIIPDPTRELTLKKQALPSLMNLTVL